MVLHPKNVGAVAKDSLSGPRGMLPRGLTSLYKPLNSAATEIHLLFSNDCVSAIVSHPVIVVAAFEGPRRAFSNL
jgi:hypothetical protein